MSSLTDFAFDRLGYIDVIVGNAGVNPYYGSIEEISSEAYQKIMNTNVYANLKLVNLVSPSMRKRGNGSIIFTSSIGAFKPSTGLGAYNMSKLSLLGLTRNLAAELGPFGIRVNSICPGLIKTDFDLNYLMLSSFFNKSGKLLTSIVYLSFFISATL